MCVCVRPFSSLMHGREIEGNSLLLYHFHMYSFFNPFLILLLHFFPHKNFAMKMSLCKQWLMKLLIVFTHSTWDSSWLYPMLQEGSFFWRLLKDWDSLDPCTSTLDIVFVVCVCPCLCVLQFGFWHWSARVCVRYN